MKSSASEPGLSLLEPKYTEMILLSTCLLLASLDLKFAKFTPLITPH